MTDRCVTGNFDDRVRPVSESLLEREYTGGPILRSDSSQRYKEEAHGFSPVSYP